MGSAVKWVFYALFATMPIVNPFHSFEYREIPGYNSLWRCPPYSGTVFKSWIQLFTVWIFALPNKSPPFRLSHFASEKVLNVYFLHFLDKLWIPEFVLLITVLNDWKKRCVFKNYWSCVIICKHRCMVYIMWNSVLERNRTKDLPETKYASIHWTKMTLTAYKISVIYTNAILAILLPVKMNEIEGTRLNSCSQAFARWNQEVKTSRMGFKYFSSGWILLVPKHSLLKYFTLTFTRHKSSKFEGSGPPLIDYIGDHYWSSHWFSNKQHYLSIDLKKLSNRFFRNSEKKPKFCQ